MIAQVILEIAVRVRDGQTVQFRGFGKFEKRFRESRKVVNPQTGESLMTESKFVPHFTPGTRFKEVANS